MSGDRISVYSLADLKGTSDDALSNYLNSLKFKQSHMLLDVRLALGYTAFAIGAACFAWDYKLGYDRTKHLSAAAVLAYMVINGLLTLWIMLREKGIVYEGTAPGGEFVSIATSTSQTLPLYNITVTTTDPGVINGREKSERQANISRPFTEWFDVTGAFIAAPFQTMLTSAVDVIGKYDTKRMTGQGQQVAVEEKRASITLPEPRDSFTKNEPVKRRAGN